MSQENETTNEVLFANLEGIERGDALLEKLKELLPDEEIPERAWGYDGFGKVTNIEYLDLLTMAVAMSDGSDKAAKVHSQLYNLIEAEKKINRFPERLQGPDMNGLENIEADLDKFSAEEITRVHSIATVPDASIDVNRQLMNNFVNHYGPILNKLLETADVKSDIDHNHHPEFWDLIKRVDNMRTAVGIMGRDGIRRISRIY
jgi:hypothetical protein